MCIWCSNLHTISTNLQAHWRIKPMTFALLAPLSKQASQPADSPINVQPCFSACPTPCHEFVSPLFWRLHERKRSYLELLQLWHDHRHLSKQERMFLLFDLIPIILCKEPALQVFLLYTKHTNSTLLRNVQHQHFKYVHMSHGKNKNNHLACN